MKALIAVMAGLALLAAPAFAQADLTSSAQTHVYLNIDPNISVQPIESVIDAGSIQTGDASLPIPFRIDANTEQVKIAVVVTPLFKGNDPLGTEVDPIPVNLSAGVDIDPANGNEVGGGDGNAEFIGTQDVSAPEGLFPGQLTETLVFESSQDGHFSQDVLVSPTWTNDDDEKPQGEYSGYVVLLAMIGEL